MPVCLIGNHLNLLLSSPIVVGVPGQKLKFFTCLSEDARLSQFDRHVSCLKKLWESDRGGGWRKQIKGWLIWECAVCDSRGAWLFWHQTGLGGGRGAACLHEPATVSVCFEEEKWRVRHFPLSAELTRLSIMVTSTKVSQSGNIGSLFMWIMVGYIMAAHRNNSVFWTPSVFPLNLETEWVQHLIFSYLLSIFGCETTVKGLKVTICQAHWH